MVAVEAPDERETDDLLSEPEQLERIAEAEAEADVEAGRVGDADQVDASVSLSPEERMGRGVDEWYAGGASPSLPIGVQADDDQSPAVSGIVDPVLAHLVARVEALDAQQLSPELRHAVDQVRADLDAGKDMTADQVRQLAEHRRNVREAAGRVRTEDKELLRRLAATEQTETVWIDTDEIQVLRIVRESDPADRREGLSPVVVPTDIVERWLAAQEQFHRAQSEIEGVWQL